VGHGRDTRNCSTSCGLEVADGRMEGKAKRRCCYGLDERGMVGRCTNDTACGKEESPSNEL